MESGPKMELPVKKEMTKDEYAKFKEAWNTLSSEEKQYLGGFYHTTDIEQEDSKLESSALEKLGKFGFSVGSMISEFLDKATDPEYWTDEEWADYKKTQEQQGNFYSLFLFFWQFRSVELTLNKYNYITE